ncbi:MAG TPA: hypothetical protein VJ346_07565 [Bacteroidales bacterium]|nr:hypothetical protein [Bacteroidales bacterium]
MKKTFFILIVCCVSCLTTFAQTGKFKQYALKSGIIEYKHSGDENGTETVYFDEYGYKVASYRNTVRHGEENKGWVITHGETQYLFDPEESSEGWKMKNPIIQYFNDCEDIAKCNEDMLAKIGYQKAGTRMFLNKNCDVWKSKNGEMLVYKGIMLRNQMSVMGSKTLQEATSFSEGATIPAAKFEVPKNIEFSEMPGLF